MARLGVEDHTANGALTSEKTVTHTRTEAVLV